MDFRFSFSRLPKDEQLVTSVNAAAGRLFQKLKAMDSKSLDISDYNHRYLKDKLNNLTNSLQLFSYILCWALADSKTPLKDFVFLEYGGGTGMLSLLAKELGIGTVLYNDIYEVSCRDAERIGKAIGVHVDHYVAGDIDEVLAFVKAKKIECRAVASYDVIEHIYDVETFFKKVPALSGSALTVMMASGANDLNPLIRYQEVKKQHVAEYQDRVKATGHKERDSLAAYLKIRKEMVLEYLQAQGKVLAEAEIELLAKNTRGMIKADIHRSVQRFIDSGQMIPPPSHPTNTCDPHTGNWAEHLMDPFALASGLADSGFSTKVLGGYWGKLNGRLKRTVAKVLNIQISLFQKHGLRVAPFYSIYGVRN